MKFNDSKRFNNRLKEVMTVLFVLMALQAVSKDRKALMVIVDGVPTDVVERLQEKAIFDVAKEGTFGDCYVGGAVEEYTQTPTISAVGYNTLLTGTWVNKHNVYGNSDLSPNYNYWTFFRIAKEQQRAVKTAIFSSWTDNRTVLLGEGKPETGGMKIDYICDGYDLDTINYPHKEKKLHVYDYDETVAQKAADCIKKNGPDVGWVYLWYTDEASHLYGNGKYFDEYVHKAAEQIRAIYEAVKYREAHYDEEWLVVVTTDHGRTPDGYSHGGQTARERKTWIAMNKKGNKRIADGEASAVDVNPTICRYMGFDVPDSVRREQDGVPLIGTIDMSDLKAAKYDDSVVLTWDCHSPGATARLLMSVSNDYKTGRADRWIELGTVNLKEKMTNIDLTKYPQSDFYKFVLENENNTLNVWYQKR